jgi:Rps23 Pro-64 3,4-dihydroxylase Tpa1-like proline 4-hydroxylase
MKKEKLKELLNELAEREFTIEEIADLFGDAERYLSEKRESEREEEDEDNRAFHTRSVPIYRNWFQQSLDNYALDYTIEDFEEPF